MKAFEDGRLQDLKDRMPDVSLQSIKQCLDLDEEGLDTRDVRVFMLDFKQFLREVKVSADFYDAAGVLFDSVKSSSTNRRIVPSHVAFIIKDTHLYHLDGETGGLFRQTDEKRSMLEKPILPSPNFFIKQKDETPKYHIEALEDFLSIDFSKVPEGRVDIRINEPLEDVMMFCLEQWKVQPRVTFSSFGRAVNSVELYVGKHLVKFQYPLAPGSLQLNVDQVCSKEYADRFEKRHNDLYTSVAVGTNVSHFSQEVLQWWKIDSRGPLVGRLPGMEHFERETSEVDVTNAYLGFLYAMPSFPVFNKLDLPERYDGHKLEPMTCYSVRRTTALEKLTWELPLLKQPVNLVWGSVLIKHGAALAKHYEIEAFVRPYKLVPNKSKEFIKALLTDDLLERSHKKLAGLKPIGMIGKKQNTNKEWRLFYNEAEALHYKKTYGGEVFTKVYWEDDLTNKQLFVWESLQRKTELVNGLWPIHHYIMDQCRSALAVNHKMLLGENKVLVGYNTDACFVAGSETANQSVDKCSVATFGATTRKSKGAPTGPLVGLMQESVPVMFPKSVELVNHTLTNEFSAKELADIAKSSDVFVAGACAGAGKTTACLNAAVLRYRKCGKAGVLVLTPGNVRVLEHLTNGYNSATYAKFLGLRVEGGALVETQKAFDLSGVKTIVFDEICTLGVAEMARLMAKVQQLRAAGACPLLLATGDVRQLPPIELFVNPHVNQAAYIMNNVRRLFPVSVTLHTPKRYLSEQDNELVLQIGRMLFEEKRPVREVLAMFQHIEKEEVPLDAMAITYKRVTRSSMNSFMHGRLHEEPLFVGLKLVYDSHTRKQGNARLIKNFQYEITEMSESSIKLREVGGEDTFELSIGTVKSWFTYTHANTGHSAQGMTYERPLVICDTSFWRLSPEWVYVALTRSKNMSTVYILKQHEAAVDKKHIQRSIDNHVATDGEDGGLTVDWVLATAEAQSHACVLCGDSFDVPRVGVFGNKLQSMSIDRINSEGKHTPGNCQLVHYSCNCAKKDRV